MDGNTWYTFKQPGSSDPLTLRPSAIDRKTAESQNNKGGYSKLRSFLYDRVKFG